MGAFLIFVYKNKLNVDHYINLVKIVIWPFTTILLAGYLFRNEIQFLLNRITGAKLPGGVEFSASQQSIDDGNPDNIDTTDPGEAAHFALIKNFFVLNTKEALKWFYEKQLPVSIDVFSENFILPIPDIEGTIEREKLVIFSVLVQFHMLESVSGNLFKISEKGKRFLIYLGYINQDLISERT